MKDKQIHVIGVALVLICGFAVVNHVDYKKEDKQLREDFYTRNKGIIEDNLKTIARIEYDYEKRTNLNEFHNNTKLNSLDYKYKIGTITKEAYDKSFSEIIDENLLEMNKHIDDYTKQLDEVVMPRYETTSDLRTNLNISKGGIIISGICLVLLFVYKMIGTD